MKNKLLALCLWALMLPCVVAAQEFINLTPKPKQLSTQPGKLVLPAQFAIQTGEANAVAAQEANKFATAISATTGKAVTVAETAEAPLISLSMAAANSLGAEGYTVNITNEGVDVTAETAQGFFYAFQSIKKLLPAHVMAGVKDESVTEHALPLVSLNDSPRFAYRGFMLDVARHFFTVGEIKRMLDVMSYYKMNNFHWHLSDDQGWRVEIKKYPKLTTVGSIAPNSYETSLQYGPYWTNRPYGPYFYTQEQIKEVIAYAAERHITVTPEIDMPGHFCAAMTAYPEYSCDPYGAHNIWVSGGISTDVLNVANPKAVQFAKDILDELTELFPGEYIHIGGDECPTTAWERNALCQAYYKEHKLTNYRQLQSHFIKEISDFLASKGKKTALWDESISAGGADTEMIKSTNALIYCWTPGTAAQSAKKAAELGLRNIYTPWGPYYINRKQSTDACESTLPGDGSDTVERTYNEKPVPNGLSEELAKFYTGVQGTFWTEHVADRELLEYLALPRLMAVAEAGWSQQADKNFNDFCKRITADTLLLNYNNYQYGRHYIGKYTDSDEQVMPNVSTAQKKYWYKLVTRAGDGTRSGRCMELLSATSPLIAQYQGNQAKANRLWTNTQAEKGAENYDYQLWAFEQDPAVPGKYALVCKAQPNGSVNPQPTANNNGGRWDYDTENKHYNFILADNGDGKVGENYFYSLRSDKVASWWMNASLGGQGLAVNLYGNPADGNSGYWEAVPLVADNKLTAILATVKEANTLLMNATLYNNEGAKSIGSFSATQADALKAVLSAVPGEEATQDELETYSSTLSQAFTAFKQSFVWPQVGTVCRFSCSVPGFDARITDAGIANDSYLRNDNSVWSHDAWEVKTATVDAEQFTVTLTLQNKATQRYMGASSANKMQYEGYPMLVNANTGSPIVCTYDATMHDFIISQNGKNLFPIHATANTLPGIVSSGSSINNFNAGRPVGAAWNIEEVKVVTFVCNDTQGNHLGDYSRSVDVSTTAWEGLTPEIENFELKTIGTESESKVTLTYERVAYAITYACRDTKGAWIEVVKNTCPVGKTFTVAVPQIPYYTLESGSQEDGTTLTPTEDQTIALTYTTEAYSGVKRLAEMVTAIKAGQSYVLYDTSPVNTERIGYRGVNPTTEVVNKLTKIEDANPYATWTLVGQTGNTFAVRNDYVNKFVPKVGKSTSIALSNQGDRFTFTLNADGNTWCIKGTDGYCWDGVANGLAGWDAPGHPYQVYEYFVQPYFEVTVESVGNDGKNLGVEKALVKAGESYTPEIASKEGYEFSKLEGIENLSKVESNITVKAIYTNTTGIAGVEAEANATDACITDIAGRKLPRITHRGLYIQNGQKIIVR